LAATNFLKGVFIMKKLLSIAIVSVFIVGCHIPPGLNEQQIYPKEIITKNYLLQPFKSIVVEGNPTVTLVNGPYGIKITGPREDLDNYKLSVVGQTLHIVTLSPSASSVFIKVTTHNLKNLTVTDDATVNAKNFKTRGLTIVARDNGAINLEGRYKIDRISQHGNGRINIAWVDSCRLFVDSNSAGPIYLAGTAEGMGVKLAGNALLEARYLYTKIASVSTENRARADILAINKLKASAIDKSNICYYKRPHYLTVITKGSGNVLYLGQTH